jgi:hypothetical protein
MKGHVWHERCDAKKRNGAPVVTYPVYVEDKHDEIRCHVQVLSTPHPVVHYMSYAGKPLANMQRFDELFKTLARGTGFYEFDMGFECNGNFNDSYRWVRSTKGVPEDLKNAKFKFYLFGLPDHPCALSKQMTYRLEVAAYALDWASIPVLVPMWTVARTPREVDKVFLNARARGLEGVMVKQPGAVYERKRTDGWLKMKPEDDADGIIEDIYEAISEDGTPLGRAGSVKVRMEDDSIARPHGIPHALGEDIWQNPDKYIGQWCEFKFMERDRQGGYRHPTFNRIREAKQ